MALSRGLDAWAVWKMVQKAGMSTVVASLRMRLWEGVLRVMGGLKGEEAVAAVPKWE
jgi:hypothetical protein